MDLKRLVVGISLSMAIFAGWFLFVNYADQKWGPSQPRPETVLNAPASTQPVSAAPASQSSVSPAPAVTQSSSGQLEVISGGDSSVMVGLGSSVLKDPQYAMLLRTTANGAGIDSIILNSYLKSVKDPNKEPYTFQQASAEVLQQFGNPLATRTITVDATPIDVSRAAWRVERKDDTSVTYGLTLGRNGVPELKVFKTYRVFPRNDTQQGGLGYEVRVDYDIENHTDGARVISLSYNGPAMPPRELDSGPDQRVLAGYVAGAVNLTVDNHYVEYLTEETQTTELGVKDGKPMYWAGGGSVYFQALLMPPLLPDGKTTSVRSFKAIGLNPDAYDRQPVALTVDTTELTVAANQRLSYPIHVFFGPKERKVLRTKFYDDLPRDYDQTLVVRTGPCSMCTFDWLINVLVTLLGWFHTIARDWGLAIICLVILVRLALHPITKRSQVSMMKMGKMGPEMKRLQEKYKDNKEELQKAMWEFQKQQGITPILGCLPMFLQMPIWIALWSALNTTFELRHSSFLWGLTWIDDLAKPDRLIPFSWSFRIPLIGTVVDAINALPILLAGVFFLQQKYTPKPPTMTKEQEQQQKIMQGMMVFLFPLFLYGQPSGLNLYILTSTAIGIWESKRIRAHIKEKEALEQAGLVIVDAEPSKDKDTNGKNKKGPPGGSKQAQPQGGWLARKLAELQEKAEQARRQSDRRKG